MVRQKVRRNNESHLLVMAEMLTLLQVRIRDDSRSVRTARTGKMHGHAYTCVGMLRYSMATTREVKGRILTTWSKEESLPWNVVDRHSFGKKSRQECRTVLKLGRNIFGLSTHHSILKKRIKKQE